MCKQVKQVLADPCSETIVKILAQRAGLWALASIGGQWCSHALPSPSAIRMSPRLSTFPESCPVKNWRATIALTRHHYLDDSFQHRSVSNPVQRTGLPCSGVNIPAQRAGLWAVASIGVQCCSHTLPAPSEIRMLPRLSTFPESCPDQEPEGNLCPGLAPLS